MNAPAPLPPDDRPRLRQHWLQLAAAVVDRADDPQPPEPPVAFTPREQRAWALTRELAAFLREQDRDRDPAARPADDQVPPCPRCPRPAQRRTPPGPPRPRRPLTCADGCWRRR